ncbi:MAG: hypothetical protein LQ338_002227 [Usnochroma carphineum]|nr:MAG: hypothetical protein LQ338_002227 [Usnochroma carphineum]
MAMSSAQAGDDSYFNDLSRQPSLPYSSAQQPPTTTGEALPSEASEVPKPKRVACAICRKRKLKCDGGRPKCGTCARLGHNCAYDEIRRKSGPKRGYVKELEARLGKLRQSIPNLFFFPPWTDQGRSSAQVETQLKTKTSEKKPPTPSESNHSQDQPARTPSTDRAFTNESGDGDARYGPGIPAPITDFYENMAIPNDNPTSPAMFPDLNIAASPIDDGMTWEMVGLGLEEPLPTQDAIDELFVTLPLKGTLSAANEMQT